MICKKCRIAVSEKEKSCKSCGSSVKSIFPHIIAAIAVIVMAAVAILVFVPPVRSYVAMFLGADAEEEIASDLPIISEVSFQPPVQPVEDIGNLGIPVREVGSRTPISVGDALHEAGEAEYIALRVAVALQNYFNRNSPTREFITQNGHLYDIPARRYINISHLIYSENLPEEFANKSIFMLYVRPDDLRIYDGITIKDDAPSLMLFAVCETAEGFVIRSSSGCGGIITGAELFELLDRYSSRNHGTLVRLNGASQRASDIESVISEYLGADLGLDVRFLVCNDKYAFAVVSPRGAPNQIGKFVLVNHGNGWEIGLSGLEHHQQYITIVTNHFPDISFAIFPSYDLNHHLSFIETDFSALLLMLEQDETFPETYINPVFISGTDEVVYMELESGDRYVILFDRQTMEWEAFSVNNYIDAEALISDRISNPPLFIVKQY